MGASTCHRTATLLWRCALVLPFCTEAQHSMGGHCAMHVGTFHCYVAVAVRYTGGVSCYGDVAGNRM